MAAKANKPKQKPQSIYLRDLEARIERLRLSYPCPPSKASLIRQLIQIGLERFEKAKV
jgi:hypothetical protein